MRAAVEQLGLPARIAREAGAALAARALRRARREARSLEDHLDLAYSFDWHGLEIEPRQVRSEIAAFLRLVGELRPRRVLEIGTAFGGTLYLLAQAAADDAVLVSVDLPRGAFGGGYPPWRRRLYRAFAARGQRVVLVEGDSHSQETAQRVRAALGPTPLDVLFVDGDHRYEGVAADLALYAPLVHERGLIALHDIVPRSAFTGDPRVDPGDVPQAWREATRHRAGVELVESWAQGGYGIGVLPSGWRPGELDRTGHSPGTGAAPPVITAPPPRAR